MFYYGFKYWDDMILPVASEHGVGITTTISHLEGLSRLGLLKNYPGVFNVPSPEKAARSDYFPGLCMSRKATEDMIFGWLDKLAGNDCIRSFLIWLSEEETRCYCDDCNGEEPFQKEVACLLRVYDRLRVKYP